jgi:hypothetical protein
MSSARKLTMQAFLRTSFIILFFTVFANPAEAGADESFELFSDRVIERCTILQPIDTRDVLTICSGGNISFQLVGDSYLIRLNVKNEVGSFYRFHKNLDVNRSRERFEALRKVANLCFETNTCNQMIDLTEASYEGLQHWTCEGSYQAIELERIWIVAGVISSLGEFRNLYLCSDKHRVRGIVEPVFNIRRTSSRPDIDYENHLFSYFEFAHKP